MTSLTLIHAARVNGRERSRLLKSTKDLQHQTVAGSGSLQLDREGIKAREDGERGRGGRFLEGGVYFKHFGLRRRLFEGRLLFEDCFVSESWLSMIILSHSNWPEGFIQRHPTSICGKYLFGRRFEI